MLVGTQKDKAITFEARQKELELEAEIQAKIEKGKKNSPYQRWTQFNNEHTAELISLTLKYPKAHAILYFLIDQMDKYNAVICSNKVIEDALHISRATIARNIKTLKDLGFIAIFKSGSSNVYAINDKVYWKSWSNNKRYSKFPANVVLSLSEQDSDYRSKVKLDSVKTITVKGKNN